MGFLLTGSIFMLFIVYCYLYIFTLAFFFACPQAPWGLQKRGMLGRRRKKRRERADHALTVPTAAPLARVRSKEERKDGMAKLRWE